MEAKNEKRKLVVTIVLSSIICLALCAVNFCLFFVESMDFAHDSRIYQLAISLVMWLQIFCIVFVTCNLYNFRKKDEAENLEVVPLVITFVLTLLTGMGHLYFLGVKVIFFDCDIANFGALDTFETGSDVTYFLTVPIYYTAVLFYFILRNQFSVSASSNPQNPSEDLEKTPSKYLVPVDYLLRVSMFIMFIVLIFKVILDKIFHVYDPLCHMLREQGEWCPTEPREFHCVTENLTDIRRFWNEANNSLLVPAVLVANGELLFSLLGLIFFLCTKEKGNLVNHEIDMHAPPNLNHQQISELEDNAAIAVVQLRNERRQYPAQGVAPQQTETHAPFAKRFMYMWAFVCLLAAIFRTGYRLSYIGRYDEMPRWGDLTIQLIESIFFICLCLLMHFAWAPWMTRKNDPITILNVFKINVYEVARFFDINSEENFETRIQKYKSMLTARHHHAKFELTVLFFCAVLLTVHQFVMTAMDALPQGENEALEKRNIILSILAHGILHVIDVWMQYGCISRLFVLSNDSLENHSPAGFIVSVVCSIRALLYFIIVFATTGYLRDVLENVRLTKMFMKLSMFVDVSYINSGLYQFTACVVWIVIAHRCYEGRNERIDAARKKRLQYQHQRFTI